MSWAREGLYERLMRLHRTPSIIIGVVMADSITALGAQNAAVKLCKH